MILGIPKERRHYEYRVGLPPAGVSLFTQHGHQVYVESEAGQGAGFRDQDYSLQGAQLDFVYGAARSRGGKPIIALPCTARPGGAQPVSRIVPVLTQGAGVVTTRNHVHYVVTEHGAANLHGKTIRERARSLIDIALPDFREGLERQAKEIKYL